MAKQQSTRKEPKPTHTHTHNRSNEGNWNKPSASLWRYECFNLHLKHRFHQFHLFCQHTGHLQTIQLPVSWHSLHIKPLFLSISIPPSIVSRTLLVQQTHPLPSISMVAERTCRSIWLIIFTLPFEAGLSWGYLHLSHLSSFVQFNSSSYYPSSHLFLCFFICTQVATVYTVHTQPAFVADVLSEDSVWMGKTTLFPQRR